MSRDFGRWLLLTTTCCMLAAAALSTVEFDEFLCPFGICGLQPGRSLRVQHAVTRNYVFRLAIAYREASDMALAARTLPSGRPAGEPEVWFAPDVPEAARQSVRASLDAHKASRGGWHGHGRVAVLVITDTTRILAGYPVIHPLAPIDVRAVLPSPETDGRCVAVIRLRGAALTSRISSNPARPLLDACAFFDAFGEPGPAIRATLDSGAFSAARLYLPAAPDSTRQLRDRTAVLGLYRDTYSDVDLYRCAAGQDAACEAVVRTATGRPRVRPSLFWERNAPPTAPLPVTAEGDGWWAGAFMDAVAADLGPERFRRFWQSREPLGDAYRTVTGHSIGQLARRYAVATFQAPTSPSVFGMRSSVTPAARFGSTALTLTAIAALLIFAVKTSRRPSAA